MASKKQMQVSKSLRYEVRYHWYLPQKQFLMLVNSSYVFQGIRIIKEKTEKINKFEIVGVQHITSKNEYLFFEQITLVNLNDNIGCIFVDHRKAKIYIFKVQRTEMQLEFDYNLYSQGRYAIFHVDNVLVAYNRNTEVCKECVLFFCCCVLSFWDCSFARPHATFFFFFYYLQPLVLFLFFFVCLHF